MVKVNKPKCEWQWVVHNIPGGKPCRTPAAFCIHPWLDNPGGKRYSCRKHLGLMLKQDMTVVQKI